VIEMETRTCAGGCGKKFRVSVGSHHKTALSDCETRCKGLPRPKEARRREFNTYPALDVLENATKYDKGILPEPLRDRSNRQSPRSGGDYDLEWKRCTEWARTLMLTINKQRIKIADLALSVCDIQHGGGNHWSGFKDVRTLKQFAKDSGMKYKTLSNWVQVRVRVMNHVGDLWDDRNWGAATRTLDRLRGNFAPEYVKKVYQTELDRKGSQHLAAQIIKDLRSVKNKLIGSGFNEAVVSPEEMGEIRLLAGQIMRALKK